MQSLDSYTHSKDKTDLFMDLLTLVLFLINATLIVYAISILPQTIPNHINFKNEIDGHGSKYTIFAPFAIGFLLCAVLYFLEGRKGFYKDTMDRIKTPEQYRIVMKTLISLKPLLAYMFLMISFLMIQTAQYKWVAYTNYFILLVLFPLPFHIVYWLYRYSRIS